MKNECIYEGTTSEERINTWHTAFVGIDDAIQNLDISVASFFKLNRSLNMVSEMCTISYYSKEQEWVSTFLSKFCFNLLVGDLLKFNCELYF